MAIGRISGHLLKSNLLRNGENLAFENDLLYLDVNTQKIGVNKSNPTSELDVDGTVRSNVLIVETIQPTTNTNSIDINASTALTLPAGSELDKLNFTAIPGQIRYNNDLDQFEGFYNSGWSPISSDTTQTVQVTTFEKTLLLTDSWTDAGINGPDLVSGTYFIEIVVNDEHHTLTTYTGVMSWYNGTTTDNYQQEIVLVKSGSDSTANIFIRLVNTTTPGYAKLQIAASESYTQSAMYTFKFRPVESTINTASFSNLASLNVLGSVTSNLNPPTINSLTVGSITSPWSKGYFQELYINNTNIIETIDLEVSTRINADITAIQNTINLEVSTRINADTSIRSLIDDESTARLNADTTIQNSINQLENSYTNNNFSFKNKIINGNFNVWQRSASQTSSGYGSDDRWVNEHVGSTKIHVRNPFGTDQTEVPNSPQYYSRTQVTSVAGAGNYVKKVQYIEDVYSTSSKTLTLSFWAKSDSNRNIAVEFVQFFGSGELFDGTNFIYPSDPVTGLGVTTFALTTNWQKFTTTVTLPSVIGKTIFDVNSLDVVFWFDAGSNYNARTNNLGQQSGLFFISQVQLEDGETATGFDNRPTDIELFLCQRYYQQSRIAISQYGSASMIWQHSTSLFREMRGNPTVTLLSSNVTNCTVSVNSLTSPQAVVLSGTVTAAGRFTVFAQYSASAEI